MSLWARLALAALLAAPAAAGEIKTVRVSAPLAAGRAAPLPALPAPLTSLRATQPEAAGLLRAYERASAARAAALRRLELRAGDAVAAQREQNEADRQLVAARKAIGNLAGVAGARPWGTEEQVAAVAELYKSLPEPPQAVKRSLDAFGQPGKPAAVEFDGRKSTLEPDQLLGLIAAGVREDPATGKLVKSDGSEVTAAEVAEGRIALREQTLRRGLLRLDHARAAGDAALWKSVVEDLRAELPGRLRRLTRGAAEDPSDPAARAAVERRREAARRLAEKRLESLYRRFAAKPVPAEFVAPSGPRYEPEERLGRLLMDALSARFREDAKGRELLEKLGGADSPRLPVARVLDLDSRYGAAYYSSGRQVIVSLAYVRDALQARLAADDPRREELEDALATEAKALAFLSVPENAAQAARALETTLYHELEHYRDDLQRDLQDSINRAELPVVVEFEYEAYFLQDLYVLSRLQAPDATLDMDRFDDLLSLLVSFDDWKGGIDGYYDQNFRRTYVGAPELRALIGRSRELVSGAAAKLGDKARSGPERLAQLDRAGAAADAELAAARVAAYRQQWAGFREAGLKRVVELAEKEGRWPVAVTAYLALHEAKPSEREALTRGMHAAELKALEQLDRGEGRIADRLAAVDQLARYYDRVGAPLPPEIFKALLRDYAAHAAGQRALAAKLSNPEASRRLIEEAESYEAALKRERDALRAQAEEQAKLFAEGRDAAQQADALRFGAETFELLGDAAAAADLKRRGEALLEERRGGGRDVEAALLELALAQTAAPERRQAALGKAARSLESAIAGLDPARMALENRLKGLEAAIHVFGPGEEWPDSVWAAVLRDFPTQAGALRRASRRAMDRAEGARLADEASYYESMDQQARGNLKRLAEADLAAATGDGPAAGKAAAAERGRRRALLLGDDELFKKFGPAPKKR